MTNPAASHTQPHRRARGLDRAFHILDYLQAQKKPLRPNEIAQGIGAPKSTVYDIINLLLEQRVLEYFDKEGRVFLGRRLYFLGLAYLRQFNLAREAEEYLEYLAKTTRETSQLCMLEQRKYTVVMMKEGARPFRISSDIGERVPLPWTASGRLLVSHMSNREILEFIPEKDFMLPNGTKLNPKTFLAQVNSARTAGFFSLDSEADNFTHCFAAAVYDEDAKNITRCIATLCLIAPREDGAKNYKQYQTVLLDCAAKLSAILAGRP